MQAILLIRHPESIKNAEGTFSSNNNQEVLTETGERQAETLASMLSQSLLHFLGREVRILTADSLRSLFLAELLSQRLGAILEKSNSLISVKAGEISGQSEAEIALKFPEYFRSLTLYRRGVVSSYDLKHKGQPLREYESRVGAIASEFERRSEPVGIIVAHRSAITALLIRYARLYHNYPANYFGYIELPLASLSIVTSSEQHGAIEYVGLAPNELSCLDEVLNRIRK